MAGSGMRGGARRVTGRDDITGRGGAGADAGRDAAARCRRKRGGRRACRAHARADRRTGRLAAVLRVHAGGAVRAGARLLHGGRRHLRRRGRLRHRTGTVAVVCRLPRRCGRRRCWPPPSGDEVLEFGAGSGRLAAELVAALARRGRAPRRYRIVEPSAALAAIASAACSSGRRAARPPSSGSTRRRATPGPASQSQTKSWMRCRWSAFGSRARAARRSASWREEGGAFRWQARPASAPLAAAVAALQQRLPVPLPPGYVSELRLGEAGWLKRGNRRAHARRAPRDRLRPAARAVLPRLARRRHALRLPAPPPRRGSARGAGHPGPDRLGRLLRCWRTRRARPGSSSRASRRRRISCWRPASNRSSPASSRQRPSASAPRTARSPRRCCCPGRWASASR